MRTRFDQQLESLKHELIAMGALCEEAIAVAAKALIESDADLATKVPVLAADIDRKEREIESLCLKLLLQQQPVARDLRQISAALKMLTDMERIGDQAADIAEIISYVNGKPVSDFHQIGDMSRAVIKMVTESVDAYVKQDITLARAVVAHDDIVDAYFTDVKTTLMGVIREQKIDGEYALDLLMMAKYFERIGDHAVNIAEWVMFSITGVHEGESPC